MKFWLFTVLVLLSCGTFNITVSAGTASCVIGGVSVPHNTSKLLYKYASVYVGQSCENTSQTRTCQNGVLSGDPVYKYASCTVSSDVSAPIVLSDVSSYLFTSHVRHIYSSPGIALRNIFTHVRYNTVVKNDVTGRVIPCGSHIPKNTRVRMEFVPHRYDDVYWFASGGSFDTPYGDWSEGAAPPPLTCVPRDLAANDFLDEGRVDAYIYGALRIAPPSKSIDVSLPDEENPVFTDCNDSLSGRTTCTASSEGTAVFDFVAEPTYGYFYLRARAVYAEIGSWWDTHRNQCTGSQSPAKGGTDTYTLEIPAYRSSCSVIVDPVRGSPPVIVEFTSNSVCTTRRQHTFNVLATDPDRGDKIRYRIDWGREGAGGWINDGQDITMTGRVNPGRYSFSRQFAVEDEITVKIQAIDNSGFVSNTKQVVITCAEEEDDTTEEPPPEERTDLMLTLLPSIVRFGTSTRINWFASSVETCTLSGTNNDRWSKTDDGTSEFKSPLGGVNSSNITSRTTYTLTCKGLDGREYTEERDVSVVPVWFEK